MRFGGIFMTYILYDDSHKATHDVVTSGGRFTFSLITYNKIAISVILEET